MRDANVHQEMLVVAQQLVTELSAGNDEQITSLIDQLAKIRETELFQEIGKLTRELHNAITSFEVDSDLSELANSEIPDTKERLNHVITMTSQAAEKTLFSVEEAIPRCEKLHDSSTHLSTEWHRFVNREMNADEFRRVSKTLQDHLDESDGQLTAIKTSLNEILMAQEFQDLTGQIINRVITMVDNVESHLVNLISVSGSINASTEEPEDEKGKLEGPQVPSLSTSESVGTQDEVDDLLSSLGF